jgi:hypothetical protein
VQNNRTPIVQAAVHPSAVHIFERRPRIALGLQNRVLLTPPATEGTLTDYYVLQKFLPYVASPVLIAS